jgi:hypothetical protein
LNVSVPPADAAAAAVYTNVPATGRTVLEALQIVRSPLSARRASAAVASSEATSPTSRIFRIADDLTIPPMSRT